jgi:hypothetical protein
MTRRFTSEIVAAGLLALASCGAGYANSIITTPVGLAPGTQYQLMFITSDTFNAESADISTYNTEVTNEAALNPALAAFDAANGVTWTDIGSTASVNANVNAPASGLVYDLDGDEEASPSNLLYSGTLLYSDGIQYTDLGAPFEAAVWAGSLADGVGNSAFTLGSTVVAYGVSALSTSGWLDVDPEGGGAPQSDFLRLYALSSVITVPVVAPEPGTGVLLVSGLGLLAGFASRNRRMRKAPMQALPAADSDA